MPVSRSKFAEWFYGGHQPRDVALAVSLGILTGALTGGNASWAVVFLAALALNVHTRLFLCAWPASVCAAWLASDSLQTVGRFLLQGTSVGRSLRQPADDLLIPLLGWNDDSVAGALVLGSAAALVAGLICYRLTLKLNRRWLATPPRPPTSQVAEVAEATRPVPPVLASLWYGPSNREQIFRRHAVGRRLRRGGMPTTLAASFLLAAACWSLANRRAEQMLWRQLGFCGMAPIAVESADISLATGRFAIRGLHFAMPKAVARDLINSVARDQMNSAGHDQLFVETAHGTLSAGLLLRGYVSIDKLVLEGVRSTDDLAMSRRSNPSVDEAAQTAGSVSLGDELVLNQHLRHWDHFRRELGMLEQVVRAVSQLPDVEHSDEQSSAAGGEAAPPKPRVEIRQMRIAELESDWRLGRKALLELKNLSSRPAVAAAPAELKLVVPKFGAEIEIAFNGTAPGKHSVRCWLCNLDLPQVVDSPYIAPAICFHAGRAKLTGEGVCDAQRIDVRFTADVDSLAADVKSDERLLGIESETWQAGLARLGGFHTRLALAGRWTAPALSLDRRELVTNFQRQLQLAGATDVLSAVNAQLASWQNRREEPLIVQASALDAQGTSHPTGLCDFSEDALPPIESEPDLESTAVVERLPPTDEQEEEGAMAYLADELEPAAADPPSEASYAPPESPPEPPNASPELPERRSLPGPMNMAVGHDPSAVIFATGSGTRAEDGSRANLRSRISRAWREKFSRQEAGSANDEPPATEGLPSREPASAAASEAWYNRRWR